MDNTTLTNEINRAFDDIKTAEIVYRRKLSFGNIGVVFLAFLLWIIMTAMLASTGGKKYLLAGIVLSAVFLLGVIIFGVIFIIQSRKILTIKYFWKDGKINIFYYLKRAIIYRIDADQYIKVSPKKYKFNTKSRVIKTMDFYRLSQCVNNMTKLEKDGKDIYKFCNPKLDKNNTCARNCSIIISGGKIEKIIADNYIYDFVKVNDADFEVCLSLKAKEIFDNQGISPTYFKVCKRNN